MFLCYGLKKGDFMIKILSVLLMILFISGCVDDGCVARCMNCVSVGSTYKTIVELCISEDNTNYSKPFDCRMMAEKQAKDFCEFLCGGD